MYHCGTPMILEHIASGMYGAVIVEPRDGYPTKVDREYVIIQSEFYAKPDPGKRKVDGAPLYVLDSDRLRAAQPTLHRVQRRAQRHGEEPARRPSRASACACTCSTSGPSKTSSFHVVGTIFDRVWIEGNPDNQFRGMQTVLLGSSQQRHRRVRDPRGRAPTSWSTTTSPTPRRARSGSSRRTAKPDEKELEHHNIPASADADRPEPCRASSLREQVPRLPLGRRGQEARARPRRRHQAAQRRLARALAQGAGEDARDRSPTRRRC